MSHVLVMVTTSKDGTCSATPWHVGDLASCERVASMLPAVATSDPDIVQAHVRIMLAGDYKIATGVEVLQVTEEVKP